MDKSKREVLRVGLPISALRLGTLIDTIERPALTTVRHYNGAVIFEEPVVSLLDVEVELPDEPDEPDALDESEIEVPDEPRQ